MVWSQIFRKSEISLDTSSAVQLFDLILCKSEKTLINHLSAVINAFWMSISDPIEFFSKSSPTTGPVSELQSPIGSQSGNQIIFNIAGNQRWAMSELHVKFIQCIESKISVK